MADTGCQSCLIGYKWIQRLQLDKRDLLPAKMKMNAANGQSIKILGAVVLRISGRNKAGDTQETKQFTYVTNDSERFFLSKSACSDLGMVSCEFPTIGTANGTTSHISVDPATPPECSCPARSPQPPLPTKLPFPATDENRKKLEQYILKHYKSSTFNTCEHQPLPLMSAPPCQTHDQ